MDRLIRQYGNKTSYGLETNKTKIIMNGQAPPVN